MGDKTRWYLCVWLDGESLVLQHSRGVRELRRVVKSVAERRFGGLEEYLEWLSGKCRMKDVKGTNALTVFDVILDYLEDEWRE